MKNDRFKEFLDQLFYAEAFWHQSVLNSRELLNFITEVFINIDAIAKEYPIDSIAKGLYEIAEGSSGCMAPILDTEIDLHERLACVMAMENVFTKIFAKKCDNIATSQSKTASRINMTCYMWWDIFTTMGDVENVNQREIDQALLNLMQRTLMIDSIPCQESALHGLSHWNLDYPEQIADIINSAIDRINPLLLDYAEDAKEGLLP